MENLYSLYDALISINVPADRARAVVDAMERDMFPKLATKTDLAYTRELLAKDMDGKLAELRHSMTLRMGAMFSGAIVILGALQKLL